MVTTKDDGQSKNLPWVEKYRPSTLDDLISHEDIIKTINRFINEDQLPHLLFYGPPGTGKTTTILACARQLYPKGQFNSMVMELNASDDRGIGVVRGQILNFASTRTIFNKGFKLIILDEADAMTNDAQNALRRIIEKFTDNVRFCLICNYLGKIIPALQSRCTRFRFGPLDPKQILPRLEYVIEQENVRVTEDGKKALMELGTGDMRKVLNILQGTATAFSEVNEENVYTCVGHPTPADMTNVLNWLLNSDFTTAYNSSLENTSFHQSREEHLYKVNETKKPAKKLDCPAPKWQKCLYGVLDMILELQITKGLALPDIIHEIHSYVHRIELPPAVLIELLIKMADIEERLTHGTMERIQLSALVGAFYLARSKIKLPE